MKLKDNKVLSDDGKVIAEREKGYGDWVSKDASVSISDILDFVNGPVIEKVEETEMVRARNDKGHYISDDPTTPENEAWTTKIIKKLVKKS
tara:strand:- start:334 stop:606 length:273 start_codon:yes stop_codon:yes gene_type:complete